MIHRKPQPDAPLFCVVPQRNNLGMPAADFIALRGKLAASARDAAMDSIRVPESWYALAAEAIAYVANAMPGGFTVDDVQDRLQAMGVDPPREPRAMGVAMQRAKGTVIVPTGDFRSGRQVKSHANPRRIWVKAGR